MNDHVDADGEDAATIARIAAEVGVSRPTTSAIKVEPFASKAQNASWFSMRLFIFFMGQHLSDGRGVATTI